MDTIVAFCTFVATLFFSMVTTIARRVLIGWFAIGFMGIFHGVVSLMAPQAWRMFEVITEVFFVQPAEWAPFVASWLNQMTGGRIEPEDIAGLSVVDMGAEAAQTLGHAFLEPMLGMIMPAESVEVTDRGLAPEAGMLGAERFLATNMSFQMQAWLLHLLGDTISFGMWKSLKDLPNAINWSYGLGWLSWMVMGVPFRMGISEPLETFYNRTYRPWRPSFHQLADGYNRMIISREDYLGYLRDMGVPERWIPVLLTLETDPLSITEMRTLARQGYLDWEGLKQAFLDRGNSPSLAEHLADAFTMERTWDMYDDMVTVAVSLYADEAMSWTDASGYLFLAGYTVSEVEVAHVLADLKKLKKGDTAATLKSLTAANIGALYRMGAYDYELASSTLRALPYKRLQIPDFLTLYTPPEPKVQEPPGLTRAAIGSMWKRRLISDEQAEALWKELDFDAETIFYWFQFYSPRDPVVPAPPPPPELSSSRLGRIYREGGLTRADALARMEEQQWDPADAALILDHLYPPPLPEVEEELRLPRGTIGSLFREGIITRADAISMWVDLGYSRAVAETLAALYEPPPEVVAPEVPPRELSTSQVGRMYRMGAITLTEGIERLERIDWRPEDAGLILTTLYAPLDPGEEEALRLPRQTVGSMYRGGVITAGTARTMWLELGYDLPTVDLLTAYYTPPPEIRPPEPPPEEFTLSQVGQLYREGAFTLEEARQRLIRLGWTVEDAHLLLTTLYAPPEPPVAEARLLTKETIGSLFREGIIDEITARSLLQENGYSEPVIGWLIQYYTPPPAVVPPPVPPRELSTSQVGQMYRQSGITLQEAVERLTRIGWREEDAELILEELYTPPEPEVEEELRLPRSTIGAMYRGGIIPDSTARSMWADAGYGPETVELLIQYYVPPPDLPPVPIPPVELSASQVGRLYQLGGLSLEEAIERLMRINWREEDAELILTVLYPPPIPPEAEYLVLTKADVGRLYSMGIIESDLARALWAALGYQTFLVGLLEQMYRPAVPPPPPQRAFSSGQVGRLLQLEFLSLEEAIERLVELGWTTTDAGTLLDAFYPPIPPEVEEPRRLARETVGSLYQEGIIDEDEARSRFLELGYDPLSVGLLLQHYAPIPVTPPPPPPPRLLTASQVGRLYQLGLLSLDDALGRLEALGFSRDDAELLLEGFYTPPPPEVEEELRLPRGTIGSMYRDGVITAEEATVRWLDQGYDEITIDLMLAYYAPPDIVPPPEPPPLEFTSHQVGKLYQLGELSLQEAVGRLQVLGWRETDARLFLTAMYPPPPPPIQRELFLPRDTIGTMYRELTISETAARERWAELGYNPTTVDILVAHYTPAPPPPPPPVVPRVFTSEQVGRLYQLGIYSFDQASSRLVELRWSRFDAETLLTAFYPPPVPEIEEPRRVSRETIGSLYRRREISEEETTRRWLALGYEPESIDLLLMYYAPPAIVPPPPPAPLEFSTAQVGRMYQLGFLTEEQASSRLVTLGWSAEDGALLLASLYPLPRPEVEEELRLPRETVGRLFNEGAITEEEALTRWLELGYDVLTVELLIAHYAPVPLPPPPPPPPEDLAPATVGRLWRSRTIDLAQALRRLELANIPERNALLYLSLYVWDSRLVTAGQGFRRAEITLEEAVFAFLDTGMTEHNVRLWLRLWT